MGKHKGPFKKGKYIRPDCKLHVKAKRDKGGAHFDLTMRFSEKDVREILKPQIDDFLEELRRQDEKKAKAA
jgi:transcription initiation factor IIE alpha subunit